MMSLRTRAVDHHNITLMGINNRIYNAISNLDLRPTIKSIISNAKLPVAPR